MKNKIIKFENIKKFLKIFEKKKKQIVLCHGVFDLLHLGHVRHFKKAKSFGDILVVSITSDKYVNKGPNRPAFNENLRAEMISAIKFVDYVVINNSPDSRTIIKELKPKIYIKGNDYKNKFNDLTKKIGKEILTVKKYGGEVKFTNDITFSSSKLINNYFNNHTLEQKNFLSKIFNQFSFDDIFLQIEKLNKIKTLVVGETIIDRYVFCEVLGKSGKEPMLTFKKNSVKNYLGGAASIANNLADFTNKITFYSIFGGESTSKKLIDKLDKKIKKIVHPIKNNPTIIKTRFIDEINKNKLMGLYQIDNFLTSQDKKSTLNRLKKIISSYDLVILADYGHGLITREIRDLLSKKSKFLAVNTQINSSNIGYHNFYKYRNADIISVNENELRYEVRDKFSPIKKIMKNVVMQKNFKNILVTRGAEGAILLNKKSKKFFKIPAFSNSVIDKIGSGDTLFGFYALCACGKLDINLSLLLSSLAASISTKEYANSKVIKKVDILKSINHLN